MKSILNLALAVLLFTVISNGQSISVHDPVMAKHNNTYYVFCTGRGIGVWSSTDMKEWKREQPVFSEPPKWAVEAVAGFRGHIWAPDISFFNGKYYLYYSVSAFGKNTSCIGLATNKTLDPANPEFKWTDHGKVIQSYPGETNWNAIDPNLVVAANGTPFLSFGSFWDGLKLVKLSTDPNPPAIDDNPKDAGGNAIEAPFIFKKGEYYYLFASIDYCCKGVNSTYKMIVGRSETIPGPYIDKDGKPMETGGGTILLQGSEKWYGVGHNSTYTFDGTDYIVFHGYDTADEGKSKLIIRKLDWDNEGWPVVKEF